MVSLVPSAIDAAARLAWVCVLVAAAGMTAWADNSPIRVAGSSWVVDAPTKIADALNLFPTVDGQPDIRADAYDSGKSAVRSLLDGESEFALAASTPVARALLDAARGNGPRLAVLAAIGLSTQTHVVIADAAAGIEQPTDLRGRRVGVMLGTSAHFGWDQFAGHFYLDNGEVTLMDLPASQQADALFAGEVEAVSTWEPWATQTRDKLSGRARVFETRHLHTVGWLLVTRQSTLDEHPKIAEHVLQGYALAIDLLDREPARALQLYADATGMQADMLTRQLDGIVWGLRLDWPVIADLETQFRWLTRTDNAPTRNLPAPADYLRAVPLRATHPQGITLPHYFFADRPPVP